MHGKILLPLAGILCLVATLSDSAFGAQTASAPPAATSSDNTAFVQAAGVDTVQARCAACHPATMVTSKRFDAKKWSEVVDQMMAKGAQVGDDEYDVIVAYLAKNYGLAADK